MDVAEGDPRDLRKCVIKIMQGIESRIGLQKGEVYRPTLEEAKSLATIPDVGNSSGGSSESIGDEVNELEMDEFAEDEGEYHNKQQQKKPSTY